MPKNQVLDTSAEDADPRNQLSVPNIEAFDTKNGVLEVAKEKLAPLICSEAAGEALESKKAALAIIWLLSTLKMRLLAFHTGAETLDTTKQALALQCGV